MITIDYNEIEFSVTRSQGPGGQHVNRTNSCVQLRFSILASLSLNDEQKQKLIHRLAHRLAQGEYILIRVESERDQKSNKDKSVKMLNELINQSLVEPKKRKATKPTKSSQRKRLDTKKNRSEIKKNRSEKIKY